MGAVALVSRSFSKSPRISVLFDTEGEPMGFWSMTRQTPCIEETEKTNFFRERPTLGSDVDAEVKVI